MTQSTDGRRRKPTPRELAAKRRAGRISAQKNRERPPHEKFDVLAPERRYRKGEY